VAFQVLATVVVRLGAKQAAAAVAVFQCRIPVPPAVICRSPFIYAGNAVPHPKRLYGAGSGDVDSVANTIRRHFGSYPLISQRRTALVVLGSAV